MIAPPAGVRIWLVAGAIDMRRGFDGLAALVAQQLNRDPFSGQVFAFRGRRGHLIKLLFWDGQGGAGQGSVGVADGMPAEGWCSTSSAWSVDTSCGRQPAKAQCR